MKDDLQRLFRTRFQILDPFQRVRAFKKIEPDDLTVTFSVRGVVRGEDVEAAAVPVIEDHAGSFGVFGTVAVNDEGDPAAVRIFTGKIETGKALTSVGNDRHANLRRCLKNFLPAVAPGVIGFFMSLSFAFQTADKRRAGTGKGIAVEFADPGGEHGGAGGRKEQQGRPAFFIT